MRDTTQGFQQATEPYRISMGDFIAERLCHLCSFRSIELKQFGKTRKGIRNSRTYQATNRGLTCSSCNGFVCLDCIKLLVPKMKADARHHLDSSILDAFQFATNANPRAPELTPPNYIGHCCIISRPIIQESMKSNTCPQSDFSCEPALLPPSPNFTTIRPSLSGCIHFPEFGIFIDSPMDCMDIHAVGAESHYVTKNKLKRNRSGKMKPPPAKVYLPARWHRVIPHTFAAKNHEKSPKLKAPIPESWKKMMINNLKINLPHCTHVKKVSALF